MKKERFLSALLAITMVVCFLKGVYVNVSASNVIIFQEDFEGTSTIKVYCNDGEIDLNEDKKDDGSDKSSTGWHIGMDPFESMNHSLNISDSSSGVWREFVTNPLVQGLDSDKEYTMSIDILGDTSWVGLTASEVDASTVAIVGINSDKNFLFSDGLLIDWKTFIFKFTGLSAVRLCGLVQASFSYMGGNIYIDNIKIYEGDIVDELISNPSATFSASTLPTNKNYSVGDIVTFGNYWQNDTNGDGTADQNDEKEPIEWRVLSQNGDDLFLMATKGLDAHPYNETYTSVTWETCTLRTWLNNDFYNDAFSANEQNAIKTTTLENEDHPEYGVEGGNSTNDKVFLLSLSDVTNTSYGFSSDYYDYDINRQIKPTEYAIDSRARVLTSFEYGGNCWSWLRSPGSNSNKAAGVYYDGSISYNGIDVDFYGYFVSYVLNAVCPALHLNLKSIIQMPEIINTATPELTPTPSATVSATATASPSVTAAVLATSTATATPSTTATATAAPSETVLATAIATAQPTVSATTSVTATAAPSTSAELTAEPSKSPVKKSVKFVKKKVTIKRGKKSTLKVKITGAKKATFTTNKKKVAKIIKAKAKKVTIKGMKKGKAVITAKAAGKKAQCKVYVKSL